MTFDLKAHLQSPEFARQTINHLVETGQIEPHGLTQEELLEKCKEALAQK